MASGGKVEGPKPMGDVTRLGTADTGNTSCPIDWVLPPPTLQQSMGFRVYGSGEIPYSWIS